MRPPIADIAAPELSPQTTWLNSEPVRMETLTAAGPVLVHFWDLGLLNSVRPLPYLAAWHERYAPALTVLGIHSPRSSFTAAEDAVRSTRSRMEVAWPVAIDSGHEIWRDYGCEGWPSLFLWGQGGALRYFHFGEGEYESTEDAIQETLTEIDPDRTHPEPVPALRPSDAPGAGVMPPTPEHFPGGSASEPWIAATGDGTLELDYEAGGAYVTAGGSGRIMGSVDGEPIVPVDVEGPGLHELASHGRHGRHRLLLEASPGLQVLSLGFAAGVP